MERDPELERIMEKKIKEMMEQARSNSSRASAGARIIELSERNFDDVISNSKPVIVDFWASWCGPCQFMLPIFDKLARVYGDKMVFARLNVDENQAVAARYDVYAIPTFIVFKDGRPIDRAVGAVGELGLEKLIRKNVGNS